MSAGRAGDRHQQRLAAAGRRKGLGAYYTPPDVVAGLLDLALGPVIERAASSGGVEAVAALRVLDPACGSGNFLVAAAARIAAALEAHGVDPATAPAQAVRCAHGVDIDPDAVGLAREALAQLASGEPDEPGEPACRSPRSTGDQVVRADALVDALAGDALADPLAGDPAPIEAGRFDVVVGNPPFLNQLAGTTARDEATSAALRRRFGDAISAYTDPAAVFLLASLDAARSDGGVVCLIEPMSFLAVRDGGGVRRAAVAGAELTDLWIAGERVFDAEVDVCAPVLVRGVSSQVDSRVRLWRGRSFEAAGDVPRPTAATWAGLAASASGHPERDLRTAGVLGDIATATADFRDQFYGLADAVVDDEHGAAPKLVTTGLIDPAHLAWGERTARFHKRTFQHPRVAVDQLSADMQAWAARRSVPKVLVATQTKVLEAVVDVDGSLLPSVPVVSVVAPVEDLWRIGALLSSPAVSLVAARRHHGSGRSSAALRLAARDLLALPLPADRAAWDRGAEAFAAAQQVVDDDGEAADEARTALLVDCARAMDEAFGLVGDDELLAWWRARLPRTRR